MGLVASFVIGGLTAIAKATGAQAGAWSGCLGNLVGLLGFCWFIAGNVWVFGNWSSVNFDVAITDASYCDETAYMFSFVLLILAWVAVPVISVTCCLCWATVAACVGLSD